MTNSLNTYILNIHDLVWFYGISSIVGYLMPNPLHAYYDLQMHGFYITFLNKPELICLCTVIGYTYDL